MYLGDIFASQKTFSPSVWYFSQRVLFANTFSFFFLFLFLSLSTSDRRIGKDDASTSTSTWPATLRLNINPSAEVAGFQLRRHDARCETDKKLPLVPG